MTTFPERLPRSSTRDGLRRFGAVASVALVLPACAAVAQPLARILSTPQQQETVTPFGGPASVDVRPRPIDRVRPARVSYTVHEIQCGTGAAAGTTCFTTLP